MDVVMPLPDLPRDLPAYREAMARGQWAEAYALLQARASAGLETRPAEELLHLADLHRVYGRQAESAAILTRLGQSSEPQVAVQALLRLAFAHLGEDRGLEEAEAALETAERRAGGDRRLRGLIAHGRSRVHWKRSEIRQAGERLEEAKRLLEETGSEEELGKVYDSLGMFHEHSGESERALSFYSLSLSKKAQWRDLYGMAVTLGNLGRFHVRLKEPEMALSYLRDDLRIAERVGDVRAQVIIKINIGQALTDSDRHEEARSILEDALAMAREQGWKEQQAYAMKDLARVVARAGDPGRASALLDTALELLPTDRPDYPTAQVEMTRGELLLDLDGEDLRAQQAFEKARGIFSALGARREEALVVHGLTRVAAKQQQWNSCLHYLEQGMNLLGGSDTTAIQPFEEILRKIVTSSRDEVLPASIGPYRIIARLGAGGFAEVFRGFDEREDASRADVAIKVLRLEGIRDEKERDAKMERFRREYEILRKVSHPNVVRVIDFGQEPVPYLAQEFAGGGDLESLVGYNKPMALEETIGVARGILRGLRALHEQGIVHRDLKPGNVILRANGQPVIVDFGVARVLDMTALTLQSAVMGTLAYMAPEQLRGESVDHRADIYSLGAMLYQLVSGRLPHEGSSIVEITRRVERDSPRDLAELRGALPPSLTRCVMRCLEKDPERRYPSADAVLADLEAIGDGADPASTHEVS